MQHPDESTIHAWLDGELRPAQAAELEAHVGECSECQSKVAEARGLVAASTRILTALDDVPRGVIPAASSRSRMNVPLLRAAALLCVVAGGAFILSARTNRLVLFPKTGESAAIADTVQSSLATKGEPPAAIAEVPSVPAQRVRARKTIVASNQASRRTDSIPAVPEPATSNSVPDLAVMAKGTALRLRAGSSNATTGAAPSPPIDLHGIDLTGVAEQASNSSDTALKILSVEHSAGETRTLYEVSKHIAVLIERDTDALATVVASATSRRSVTAGAGSFVGTQPKEARSSKLVFQAPSVITIEWKDITTGKSFVLSGPFSLEELRDFKQRIIASRLNR